jgi:hypothetical protein
MDGDWFSNACVGAATVTEAAIVGLRTLFGLAPYVRCFDYFIEHPNLQIPVNLPSSPTARSRFSRAAWESVGQGLSEIDRVVTRVCVCVSPLVISYATAALLQARIQHSAARGVLIIRISTHLSSQHEDSISSISKSTASSVAIRPLSAIDPAQLPRSTSVCLHKCSFRRR